VAFDPATRLTSRRTSLDSRTWITIDSDVARKTDRFTVDMAPISSALWYTGSARTVESLRRKGNR
jgi:hypothetical protein